MSRKKTAVLLSVEFLLVAAALLIIVETASAIATRRAAPNPTAVAHVRAAQPIDPTVPFGGTAAPTGTPGSSPANPMTQIGEQPPAISGLAISWPDGTTERVPVAGQLSITAIEAIITARAQAEGRSPVTPTRRLSSANSVKSEIDWGTSWCNYSLVSPYKYSATGVMSTALVNCSTDVDQFNGSLGLYRSANYTQIGIDNEISDRGAGFNASGTCLSSLWQYNSYLYFQAVSETNGGKGYGLWSHTEWISC